QNPCGKVQGFSSLYYQRRNRCAVISIDFYLNQYNRQQRLPEERPPRTLHEACAMVLRPAAACPLYDQASRDVVYEYHHTRDYLDEFADALAREMYKDPNPAFHKQCREVFDRRKREFVAKCRDAWGKWDNPTGQKH